MQTKQINRSIKSCLQDNDIEMYSTHNKEKSVLAERFIRTIKNKIYKYMTSVPKNVYIDQLDYTVNECNNLSSIKTKPVCVISSTYMEVNKENKKEDHKFEVGDPVRISSYKNILTKKTTRKIVNLKLVIL